MPKICDYEGSNYRTEFWEGRGRNYEDRVERVALRRLLPHSGNRLLEIGAGFGRLTDEFHNFQQVVVLDYSFSQLQYAQEHHGRDKRFVYVAADAYKLPFKAGVFDAATMIRVIHHMSDAPLVLSEIRRVLVPESTFILEFANKQNLKAILRYMLKLQDWSPFSHEPVEFVELNFDFHPAYILKELTAAGFSTEKRIPVSFFRVGILKNVLPTGFLVGLDSLLQYSGVLFTPSIFTKNKALGASVDNLASSQLFICPECKGKLIEDVNIITCQECHSKYAIRDGIYDFKASLD